MRAARAVAGALALLLLAADEPTSADFAADARSIEALVNAKYAYLDRFPGGRMPMTAKLRAEADNVASARELVRYSERALALLADHHAITGASMKDSWAVFPSYGDLWVEPRGRSFIITAVREDSPAQRAGIRRREVLAAIDGVPTGSAVAAFWTDLGAAGGGERDGYAARVLAAGRRDRPRRLAIGQPGRQRELIIPSLYAGAQPQLPPVSAQREGRDYHVRFNDSLGDGATIAAFDAAMSTAPRNARLIIDLRNTPSGGNTTIARAVLGWFVSRPTFYQIHHLPVEERETGIARQWVEQVLPRAGKRWRGPVVVRVGRWTGSMGEGMAIGLAAIGARVEGDPMAGLLGAIYDYRLDRSGQTIKLPTERLYAVDGTPRERFMPRPSHGSERGR